MKTKTVATTAGVNAIHFDGYTPKYYWIKNLSDATLYVSANPNPVAGADNVSELSAKSATAIETDEGTIYILGAGKVEIHNTDSKICPFVLTA